MIESDRTDWFKRAPHIVGSVWRSRFGVIEFEHYFVRISSKSTYLELQEKRMFVDVLNAVSQSGHVAQP
jgi:hypothetical protein